MSAGGAASGVRISSPTSVIPLPETDLKTLIHEHSIFFDRLVEVIPARFYLPTADEDKPWFQGLSKAAKISAKKQSRENLKKARRARLDPSTPTSTLDLLKKSISDDANSNISSEESEEEDDDDDEVEDDDDDEDDMEVEMAKSRPPAMSDSNRSVTYEELRERLHKRIAELRAGRNTRPESQNKMKKPKKTKGKKDKEGEEEESGSKKKRKREEEEDEKIKKKANLTDLSFGKVKMDGVGDKRKKGKKLSKQQELEKARKLEEAKKDPEKGEEVVKKHSWKAAVSRAAGEKVHDDPKLLKESIKKEKKKQQKHAEKWKERRETVGKVRSEKQKTRTENIRERIHQKKMRRIEKREKKLMRPGFEGRKEGYINQ